MVTQRELKELFDYSVDTGIFIRKNGYGKKGVSLGTLHGRGYLKIEIKQIPYYLHRLAWIYIHGDESADNYEIDHINRNPSDNRLVNLRLVSHAVNMRNRTMSMNNTSGQSGVYYIKNKKRWGVAIGVTYLGSFLLKEDAILVRKEAEKSRGYIIKSQLST